MKNSASKICHIIGGGPSLDGFNWRSLDQEFCIAINDAYKVLPNARVVMYSCGEWLIRNLAGLHAHSAMKFGVTRFPEYVGAHQKFFELELTTGRALDTRPGKLAGNNTGHMAINFAVNCGFREIWLYGFDGGRVGGLTHWHESAVYQSGEKEYAGMRRGFDLLGEPLRRLGVRVWNLSPDSAITTFPKINARPLAKPGEWTPELTSPFRQSRPVRSLKRFRQG
jgi:hypothetical protein